MLSEEIKYDGIFYLYLEPMWVNESNATQKSIILV